MDKIFYTKTALGKKEIPFEVIKFRTMIPGSDKLFTTLGILQTWKNKIRSKNNKFRKILKKIFHR